MEEEDTMPGQQQQQQQQQQEEQEEEEEAGGTDAEGGCTPPLPMGRGGGGEGRGGHPAEQESNTGGILVLVVHLPETGVGTCEVPRADTGTPIKSVQLSSPPAPYCTRPTQSCVTLIQVPLPA
ncbi:hypothetical protein EYF80_022001 [Liparis tanakae]|uniref:Uncharacterized protein n=1 Tax=Liparis tanakae TaxID=230148 RepID=A0A4Z2HPZ5_9TELE|nr:hypothetical protein EYF80_022001 [Liparis tanakae]